MTDTTIEPDTEATEPTPDSVERSSKARPPLLFALAIFTSATLVFVVQPMVTKLVLPMLGGSPSVWNTSMVFFQTALLAGYGYAHLLQRVSSLRNQVIVHLTLLLVAALFLPLHISGVWGEPQDNTPALWLLGTLAVSVGAPFAILSATAPLLQAWFARVRANDPDGANPYVLYAASNLGSFLALLAYPIIIEPLMSLSGQRLAWSGGYAAFVIMIAALAWTVGRFRELGPVAQIEKGPAISWKDKLILVALAAAPSSLMLGLTAHLATDVASAPFLWVLPLALYLLTFVIAFQAKPIIPLAITLPIQAALGAVCVIIAAFRTIELPMAFGVNVLAFFFTALMCHQLLAARRPQPGRLTEFYLLLSLGGVVGGVFNALIAPVAFNMVWEYPLVLVLVGLARPWRLMEPVKSSEAVLVVLGVVFCLIPPLLSTWLQSNTDAAWAYYRMVGDSLTMDRVTIMILGGAAICAFLSRDRAPFYVIILACMTLSAQFIARGYDWSLSERSFFGVMRVANVPDARLGGDVHVLMHGTTLHGAQAQHGDKRCLPTLYYAPQTPIGQAAMSVRSRLPAAKIGVVGQGSGAMAAYKRAEDSLTFFEIDPMVDRLSRNPEWFSFISACASGPIETVIGDARQTLAHQPKGTYDLLLVDAFSSDAVPTHLLTEQAIEDYLSLVKPDGVVVLHLSNRNLDILRPAAAAARDLGKPFLHQVYLEPEGEPDMALASTEALILSPTEAGLAPFRQDSRWAAYDPQGVRPWTDDYVNLVGAMWRNAQDKQGR